MSPIVKVSGQSSVKSLANVIAVRLRTEQKAVLQAIGANAVNQSIKAMAVAREHLKLDALDLFAVAEFVQVEVDTKKLTAIRFTVHASHLSKCSLDS